MTKELVISVIIVVVIIVGDIFTTKYTDKSIETTTQSLSEIREEMEKENEEEIDADKLKEQIKNIRNDWNKRHKKLAIYIEHDELEKIETNLAGLNGYLDKEEYGDSMAQLDISVYVLEHIKNKTILSLINSLLFLSFTLFLLISLYFLKFDFL